MILVIDSSIVAHGHQNPEIEQIVERHPRYDVVAKYSAYQGDDPTMYLA
jgi:hypothetical protein